MTDEVKNNLPELLNHTTTLKKSSWDKQKREYIHIRYMYRNQ